MYLTRTAGIPNASGVSCTALMVPAVLHPWSVTRLVCGLGGRYREGLISKRFRIPFDSWAVKFDILINRGWLCVCFEPFHAVFTCGSWSSDAASPMICQGAILHRNTSEAILSVFVRLCPVDHPFVLSNANQLRLDVGGKRAGSLQVDD